MEAPWGIPAAKDARPRSFASEGVEHLRSNSIVFRIFTSACGLFHSLAFTGLFAFPKLSANRIDAFRKKLFEPIKLVEKPLQASKFRLLIKQAKERHGPLCLRCRRCGKVTDVDVGGKPKQQLLELTPVKQFQTIKKFYAEIHQCPPLRCGATVLIVSKSFGMFSPSCWRAYLITAIAFSTCETLIGKSACGMS